MKISAGAAVSAALSLTACQAFVMQSRFLTTDSSPAPSTAVNNAVELEAEPEGGEELTALTSIPGCRVKRMGELEGVKCDFGTPYVFWLMATVDGALIKEVRSTILRDASKKANFPGFRKGQVPPYAMPQILQFSVQESVIKTVQAVVDSYGLKELSGSDGQVEVKEDVEEMAKTYKTGEPLLFTATLNGSFDPEKHPSDIAD